jgi:hypothetical protein
MEFGLIGIKWNLDGMEIMWMDGCGYMIAAGINYPFSFVMYGHLAM